MFHNSSRAQSGKKTMSEEEFKTKMGGRKNSRGFRFDFFAGRVFTPADTYTRLVVYMSGVRYIGIYSIEAARCVRGRGRNVKSGPLSSTATVKTANEGVHLVSPPSFPLRVKKERNKK